MNSYQIVADESVDFRIVTTLREAGFSVYSIMEENASLNDEEVLNMAVQQNAILITEDKDFGELVFRMQMAHKGILLLRLVNLKIAKDVFVVQLLKEHFQEILGKFAVLNETVLRIRD